MARIVIPARAFEDKVVVGFLNAILNRIQSLNDDGSVNWSDISKAGSNLTDIEIRLFSALQGKPTTLAGYGITDGVPNARAVSAGDGLTGGGALSADISIALAAAALATIGGVLKAAASPNATTSTVAVSSADAPAQGAAYNQANVQAIATLANELKADLTQLVTDLNATVTSLNDLKAKLRAAGTLET